MQGAGDEGTPIPQLVISRWIPAACALCALACGRAAPVTEDSGGAALMRNLLWSRGVDVELASAAHGAEGSVFVESLARAMERAAGRSDRAYRLVSTPAERDTDRVRIVVGTSSEPRVRALASRLGVVLESTERGPSFRWRDQAFDDPRDGLIATFEDPERPGLPVTVYMANTVAALPGYLGGLEAGWRPWVRMFRAGELMASGPLRLSGAVVLPRLDWLGDRRWKSVPGFEKLPPNDLGIAGRASAAIGVEGVERYLAFAREARARLAAWAEPREKAPALVLWLYAQPDEFLASSTTDALSVWNPVGNTVHALCRPDLPHDGGRAIARAAAQAWLGDPALPWLADGAATDASRVWWNVYLERWIAWLHRAGLVPPLAVVTDEKSDARLSPHLLIPSRAALFRFLLEARGAAFVRDLWHGSTRLSVDADLQRAFDAHWAAIDERYRDAFSARRRAGAGAGQPSVFLKGVGLEPPGSDPERGFGSRRCEQSLTEIRTLGANAVALSASCVNQRDPPRLAGLGARRPFAPVEGDLALYLAFTAAKTRGLATFFSPRLLSGPGGSLNGDWVRGSHAAWEEFFASYERFVVHCALLAELCRVDCLSLGSDIPDIARGTAEGRRARPAEVEEKRAGWNRVISAARGAFAGRLTYTAASIDEAQKIAFWRDLDAVGFEIFHPQGALMGERPQAIRDALLWTLTHDLESVEAIAESNGKPFIVTQVGFNASISNPSLPRAGPGSVDLDSQADAYALLETALAPLAARRRLQGVFVWRASTDPDDTGVNARDFLFEHRPATAVVKRMFGGL
jgi:hypothetical protein